MNDGVSQDPHADAPVHHAGAPVAEAACAIVLLHGRGGSAVDMLQLAMHLEAPGVAFVAPQAAGSTWYPQSFLAPTDHNEPYLSSAHACVARVLRELEAAGLEPARCGLIGFSQGACLAGDHVARFPRRYALLAAYTGGLIGPPGTAFTIGGNLEGTPAFLGASDPDPHVPWDRVSQTADLLRSAGADVELRRYPGEPHAINADEISHTRDIISAVLASLA